MIELPLVFLAGALGSSHCVGMCGGFALLLGTTAPTWKANLGRQLIYSLGRLFTYGVAGAAAGFGGWRLADRLSPYLNVPAVLALAAGAILIYQGLRATGILPGKRVTAGQAPCLASGPLATLLRGPTLMHAFLGGLFTGLMPCGLLYGFLSLAASTESLSLGLATMLAFGLGTVPLMVLTGAGGSLLSIAARQRVLRAAAWCLVVAGLISVARGAGYVSLAGNPPAGCPACRGGEPQLPTLSWLRGDHTDGAVSDR